MKILFRSGLVALALSVLVSGPGAAQTPAPAAAPAPAVQKYAGKKILYVNSYHKGYSWSDGIERGIHTVLDPSGVELRVQYMDTKNHPEEDSKKKVALETKAIIDTWKPDVVITSDDNAVRYVLMPYYKDAKVPFVFNGVNWDADQYGLPYKNATGMLEVDSVDQLLKMLKSLKPGAGRTAVLTPDTESDRAAVKNQRKAFGITDVEVAYVATFDEWKKHFIDLQGKADILQVQNNAGIKGWNDDEARKFALENTRIPTGSIDADYMAPFAMILYAKVPEEQGEWSAKTALEILGGRDVSSIPITRNTKGSILVNTALAHKIGVNIPTEILEVAKLSE